MATYVPRQVNHKLGVSHGTFTSKLALPRDLQHKKRKARAVARAAKQRHIRLKTGTAFKGQCKKYERDQHTVQT
ncbi:hypothetical protein DPMN_185325 [Dreissena polymorpha]|uniref:Uncharacterized protein n=1 Tax=Dreissena polymorpha TaxID=45954 RepID=A0A9D4I8M1_DREPO|nr:hypothetical protein DPMN_185325 [Dreissena polymorpha]